MEDCKGCQCLSCDGHYECDTCRECSRNFDDNYSSDNWCDIKEEAEEE